MLFYSQSYKAPTTVLLDENEDFLAFGFKAEHMYLANDDDEDDDEEEERKGAIGGVKRKQLYRNFKMMLHNKMVYMYMYIIVIYHCFTKKTPMILRIYIIFFLMNNEKCSNY